MALGWLFRRGRGPRRLRSSGGFTLLEISIGMAILGLGVVSALQVFGSSLQLARAASKKTEAVVHAKALMDAVLWQADLAPGVTSGEIGDGFRWKREIRQAGPDDGVPETEYRGEVRLAVVSVRVEWDDQRGVKEYTLGTMRVVADNGD